VGAVEVENTVNATGRSPGISAWLTLGRAGLRFGRRALSYRMVPMRRHSWRRLMRRIQSALFVAAVGIAGAIGLIILVNQLARAISAVG
jgi:hypothetical protein